LQDAIQDPDSGVFDPAKSRIARLGFNGYLVLCFLATTSISGATVVLWSEMGCGPDCLEFLQENSSYAPYCGGVVFFVVLALYMLDFFFPPHLPGMYCTLSEGGSIVARCFLAIAVVAFLAMCFLSSKHFPTAPLVLSIFLCPASVMLLRQATKPKERFLRGRQVNHIAVKGGRGKRGFERRMELLKLLTGEERDQKNFYIAATSAFMAAGALSLCAWLPWAIQDAGNFEEQMAMARDRQERELVFVRWAAPVIVAVSNLVFASFTGLRVALNRAYAATDEVKNRLIIGGTRCCMNQEMMDHRITMLQERLSQPDQSPGHVLQETQDKMQQYLVQHISHMRQLSNIVKSVGCAFIAMIGALYVAFQLTAADSHIAFMVQGFLGTFFLTFLLIIFVSFGRLWQAMSVWLTDLPLWKSAVGLCYKDWARAFVVCMVLPLAPIVVALSVVNQSVRRCRGLCKDQAQRYLTERIHDVFVSMRQEWDWVRIVFWCYLVATTLMVYKIIPVLLNVLLAWMSWLMDGLGFVWILVATFATGMVLFMLPPIPGPPIYLFGGVVISEKCPWGFWWGSLVCILLSFALKLTACAMQQKIFGEWLGTMPSVRRAVGVHKPLIRAIEVVLRRPGLSFGKCMILCGGPDWPTSVLAGILRLSLRQCLLGTLPIIFNVVPLTLTGSFYLKRDVSQVWVRAGNLMFSLTALVSVVFWAGMGWAIQDVFEKDNDTVTRPMEEFVELEWLDYRAASIASRCRVVWADLPCAIGACYVAGAVVLNLTGLVFFWRSAMCFGSFKVTDDVLALRWFGNGGLIRPPGLVGLAAAAASYLGLFVYLGWYHCRGRASRPMAAQAVDALEAGWKERRLREAREARCVAATPRSFGNACLPTAAELAAPQQDLAELAATSAADANSAHREVPASRDQAGRGVAEDAPRLPDLHAQRTTLAALILNGPAHSGPLSPIEESPSWQALKPAEATMLVVPPVQDPRDGLCGCIPCSGCSTLLRL